MSGINPPPMLLLDEDVRPLLAEVLRQRGYDAVHVLEIDRGGYSDNDQLDYASNHGRTLLTHNIRDFLVLDQAYRSQGREHGVANQGLQGLSTDESTDTEADLGRYNGRKAPFMRTK